MPRWALTAPSPYGGHAVVLVATGARDTDRILRKADPDDHVFYAWKDDLGWRAYVKHKAFETVRGRKKMQKLARGFAGYFNIPEIAEQWIRNGAYAELAIVIMPEQPDDQHREEGDATASLNNHHS